MTHILRMWILLDMTRCLVGGASTDFKLLPRGFTLE